MKKKCVPGKELEICLGPRWLTAEMLRLRAMGSLMHNHKWAAVCRKNKKKQVLESVIVGLAISVFLRQNTQMFTFPMCMLSLEYIFA